MYADLEGMEGVESDDDSDSVSDGDDAEEEQVSDAKTGERPAEWMWHGYMAFMLFGTHVQKEYWSNLFNTKDPIVPEGGKKENGSGTRHDASNAVTALVEIFADVSSEIQRSSRFDGQTSRLAVQTGALSPRQNKHKSFIEMVSHHPAFVVTFYTLYC